MTRLFPVALLAGLALTGAAAAQPPEPRDPATPVRSPAAPRVQTISAVAELEHQTLAAINDVRHEHGLSPLRANAKLAAAAREHSRSMAEHGFFRHASYDGSAFWRRIKPVFPPARGRYWGAGENMVWASPGLSARMAIEMWLKSPPHRKNLLTPSWREVGIGGVHALAAPGVFQGLDVTIVVADFGVR